MAKQQPTVRVRLHQFSEEWLLAVAALLAAVDDADPVMVDGPVRDAADDVRAVMFASYRAAA
jgi:hypothetical protein